MKIPKWTVNCLGHSLWVAAHKTQRGHMQGEARLKGRQVVRPSKDVSNRDLALLPTELRDPGGNRNDKGVDVRCRLVEVHASRYKPVAELLFKVGIHICPNCFDLLHVEPRPRCRRRKEGRRESKQEVLGNRCSFSKLCPSHFDRATYCLAKVQWVVGIWRGGLVWLWSVAIAMIHAWPDSLSMALGTIDGRQALEASGTDADFGCVGHTRMIQADSGMTGTVVHTLGPIRRCYRNSYVSFTPHKRISISRAQRGVLKKARPSRNLLSRLSTKFISFKTAGVDTDGRLRIGRTFFGRSEVT